MDIGLAFEPVWIVRVSDVWIRSRDIQVLPVAAGIVAVIDPAILAAACCLVAESEDAVKLDLAEGDFEFRDVSFAYEDSGKGLQNLSFKISAGTRVGNSSSSRATPARKTPSRRQTAACRC